LQAVKRIVILAALAGALVLPAQASAKTWHYSGTVPTDPTGRAHVSFDVVKKKGKKGAKDFAAESIHSWCDNGASQADLDFQTTGDDWTKVKKNRFHFKAEGGGGVAKFSGKLSDHGHAVQGFVSWKGLIRVGEEIRDCVTGKVGYSGGRT
jgi:hypothetical protein